MTPQEQADAWNAKHPVGTAVTAYPGFRPEDRRDAKRLQTRTRTRAWVMGGHTAVVSVTGYAGGIALTHVDPVEGVPAVRPTCPLCQTTLGQRSAALPDGRRGHPACVNAHRAKNAKPEPRHDRNAARLARLRGDLL